MLPKPSTCFGLEAGEEIVVESSAFQTLMGLRITWGSPDLSVIPAGLGGLESRASGDTEADHAWGDGGL